MARNNNCCLCGEPRKPTQKPVESFGNMECIEIGKHRELQPGRWEHSPQLLVNVGMWRNGGVAYGDTHMCDGCIAIGLRAAKRWIDEMLVKIET